MVMTKASLDFYWDRLSLDSVPQDTEDSAQAPTHKWPV